MEAEQIGTLLIVFGSFMFGFSIGAVYREFTTHDH